jgi:thioredoxin-related protein
MPGRESGPDWFIEWANAMRRLAATILVSLSAALTAQAASGVLDKAPLAAAAAPYELVVFEADGCIYCEMLRRDAAPLYTSSEVNRDAPIRFVNVSHADETRMELAGAITIAPTVVLLREGREVDRITGYTGPFNFVQLVERMMGREE